MHSYTVLDLLKRLNRDSVELLLKYPFWRNAVLEAESKSQLPANYQPRNIEFFDQQGLLASRLGSYIFNALVPASHHSEFVALYFDSELVSFVVGNEIIINRLRWVSLFGLFDLGGQ